VKLELQPITYKEAVQFIKKHHSHHLPPQGWKFGIAVNDGQNVVGVITVGRPVARMLDDGWTLEVTRNCTDKTKQRCINVIRCGVEGDKRRLDINDLITYTLESETGTSLVAAGYKELYKTKWWFMVV